MKEYISPEMKFVKLDFADIIVTSDGYDLSDQTPTLPMKSSYFFASGSLNPDNPDFSDKYAAK
ncbi:MAG: hypothetical protein IIZ59_03095 [Clostridia bacterium]|nr:hypothetical protein [Clostridia bacterium]